MWNFLSTDWTYFCVSIYIYFFKYAYYTDTVSISIQTLKTSNSILRDYKTSLDSW